MYKYTYAFHNRIQFVFVDLFSTKEAVIILNH